MSQRVEFDGCADVLDRLEAFIDGDLDRAEAIAVEAHLAGCAACHTEHRLAEEVLTELRALPEFEVPETVGPLAEHLRAAEPFEDPCRR